MSDFRHRKVQICVTIRFTAGGPASVSTHASSNINYIELRVRLEHFVLRITSISEMRRGQEFEVPEANELVPGSIWGRMYGRRGYVQRVTPYFAVHLAPLFPPYFAVHLAPLSGPVGSPLPTSANFTPLGQIWCAFLSIKMRPRRGRQACESRDTASWTSHS